MIRVMRCFEPQVNFLLGDDVDDADENQTDKLFSA